MGNHRLVGRPFKKGHKVNWKGGVTETNGYITVYSPTHPHAYGHGKRVYQHRLVMEAHLGRTLLPTEVVHHINGDKKDNRIENLMLFSSQSDHARYEKRIDSK